MARLEVVPIYLSDQGQLLERLSRALERSLRASVRRRVAWFDPEVSFDPARGQYNSTRLLRMLLDDPGDSKDWVLGVASVDLFIPVLTHVFGEAQLGGRAAIVSTHRLRTENYGLPQDEDLLLERLIKEAVHEMGHVLGLVHCLTPDCVMHASTYVDEIDTKSSEFCTSCESFVHKGNAYGRS